MLKIFRRRKGARKARRGGVIDLGKLHKRGIIKLDSDIEKEEYKQLGKSYRGSEETGGKTSSPLGFLGSLAGASEEPSSTGLTSEQTSTPTSSTSISDSSSHSIRRKKLKRFFSEMIEKQEQVSNQLSRLVERIELLEKKIARLERKSSTRGAIKDFKKY